MFSYLREFVVIDVKSLGYIQQLEKTICLVRFDAIKIENDIIVDRIKVYGYKNKVKQEFKNCIKTRVNINEEEKALEIPIQKALNKVYDFVSDKTVVMWDNVMYDTVFDKTDDENVIKQNYNIIYPTMQLYFKNNKQVFIQDEIEDCEQLEDFDGYLGLFEDVAEFLGVECNGRDGVDIIYDIMKKLRD